MWNSRGEELCLICDIGTASVSVAVVFFAPHKKPSVLSSERVPLTIGKEPIEISEERIVGLLDSIIVSGTKVGLSEAKKKGIKKRAIERVFVTLSAPWHISKSTRVIIEKSQPFLVTEEAIQSAVLVEERKFEEEILAGSHAEFKGKSIKTIEREVVSVDLNGYRTSRPYGKEATVAEVTVFMSIMSLTFFSKVQERIMKHLHMHEVSFHTFPLSFFGAVSRLYPREENALLIDIGGESTSLSLMHKGALESSVSFSSGVHHMIRSVMEQFSVPEEVARSYIDLIGSGKGEVEFVKKLEEAVVERGKIWRDECLKYIERLTDSERSPRTCFLIAQKGMNPAFKTLIELFNKQYTVISLDEQILFQHAEVSPRVIDAEFLLLEAFFLEYHDIHLER